MRHSGLTQERHEQIARRLQQIRDELLALSIETSNSYPKSGHLAGFGNNIHKAVNALDIARSRGESAMVADTGCADINVYYRHPKYCGDECSYQPKCSEK